MSNTKENIVNKISTYEIIKLKECGLTYREISSMCGVSKQWIHYIIKRNSLHNQILTLNKETVCLLRKNRFERNLSVEKYASELGLSVYITRKILTTNHKVKWSSLVKIAEYLNSKPEDLIEKNVDKYMFLPKDIDNLEEVYNDITYKNIQNKISYNCEDKSNNGLVKISKKMSDIIKAYRLTKGYTIKEFAQIANLSSAKICQLENRQCSSLRYSTLNKIAKTLNVSVEKLLICDLEIKLDLNILDVKININESISEKIKKKRRLLNISQYDLGKRCGGDQYLISMIELGKIKRVKKSILNKICTELRLNYERLVDEYAINL